MKPSTPRPSTTSEATHQPYSGMERRSNSLDRRRAAEDRRNLERVNDDDNPRRDPELAGRRRDDLKA